jgi:hypothetical protein
VLSCNLQAALVRRRRATPAATGPGQCPNLSRTWQSRNIQHARRSHTRGNQPRDWQDAWAVDQGEPVACKHCTRYAVITKRQQRWCTCRVHQHPPGKVVLLHVLYGVYCNKWSMNCEEGKGREGATGTELTVSWWMDRWGAGASWEQHISYHKVQKHRPRQLPHHAV